MKGEEKKQLKERKKEHKKHRKANKRLNQLHPQESFICIGICSEPEQTPDAFVSSYL
jgi:uncharacterized protein YciI